MGLDWCGISQILVYAEDVILIGNDNTTIERNANMLLNACTGIVITVNLIIPKYMEVRGKMANKHNMAAFLICP